MATTGLEVKLRAGHDRAEVSRFTKTINEVVLSLREIDRVYVERATRATWVVADLANHDGDLSVRLEARPHPQKRPSSDMLVPAVALVNGAAHLAEVAEVPELYSPRTVRRLADISTPRDGVQDVTVATYNGAMGRAVPLSQEVREHARQAVRGGGRSFGTFSGQLDLIGRHRTRRGGLRVSFYDRRTRHAIDGIAPLHMEEQIHELFGMHVLAGGIVIRNSRGQPIRIEVNRLETLTIGSPGKPNTEELLGLAPEWLGDLTVDEYIAEVRGA